MDAAAIRVALPGGSWLDGTRLRHATIRPLTGADEAMLSDASDGMLPAERVSALLGRCATVDNAPASGVELARQLSIGDREALLLHLHRLTFGDALRCVLTCPNPACGAPMDLELSAADLLLPPYADAAEWYDVSGTTSAGGLRFRLPTGRDQESAAALARTHGDSASAALARRCVAWEEQAAGDESIDDETYHLLATAMLDRDPQAEITLDVTCPECGCATDTLFDAGSFLHEELAARRPRLYRDVHTIALHYHWSESEILGLTRLQRQRYLDLLAETQGAEVR